MGEFPDVNRRMLASGLAGPPGLLVALWLFLVFVGGYSIVPASVMSVIMAELSIGPTAASWVLTAPQVAAAVVGLPVGIYLDRIDNRTAAVASVLVLLVAGAWGWFAADAGAYWSLIASRLLGGTAFVTFWVAGANLLTGAFPAGNRATAVAVYTTGYPVGYAVGQYTGPLIAEGLGWAAIFAVFAVLGLVVVPALVLVGRGVDTSVSAETTPELGEIKRVLLSRGVWVVGVMSFTIYSLYMLVNSWMPTYSAETFGLSLAESGLLVALFPATGVVARTAGGVLSDRVFGHRRRPVVLVSFAVTSALVVALYYSGTVALFLLGIVAAGVFVQLQIGLLYTYAGEFVGSNVAGTAIAIISVVGWGGAFVAPAVAGALLESTGSYVSVFAYALALGLFGVGVTVLAPESRT